jgi:hypothetical protein
VTKFLVFSIMFSCVPCFAQDIPRLQGKVVFRVPVPQGPGWYLAGWNITNFRQNAPDNTNFMLGGGRKLENGWIEFMAQKQYSVHSNPWFFDFRLQRKLAERFSTFVEIAPFLETKALYEFWRLEYRVHPRFTIMAESENIHRQGRDSLGIGPGINFTPMRGVWKLRFAPAVSWQIRREDPDFIRFYFAFPF